MFEKYRKFETTFAGRPLVVETGKTCELSMVLVGFATEKPLLWQM